MIEREYLQAIRILIVEDSKTQAMFLMNMLEVRGYELKHVFNGVEALDLLKKEKPDIIISDVVMPLMDGYDLCKTIKSDSRLSDIPVILLTSMTDPQNLLQALISGADSFLTKPYKIQAVTNCLQTILANPITANNYNISEKMEIDFLGHKESLQPNIRQITNFLLSSYENTMEKSNELEYVNKELIKAKETINSLEELNSGLKKSLEGKK